MSSPVNPRHLSGAATSHDAVAHDLFDCALVAVDGVHDVLEDGIEAFPGLLGVPIGENLHRALEIGEQDRDVLPLIETPAQAALGSPSCSGPIRCVLALAQRSVYAAPPL
jgi:hypothetical protein